MSDTIDTSPEPNRPAALSWKVRIDDFQVALAALEEASKTPKGALTRVAASYGMERWEVTDAIDRVEKALELRLLDRKSKHPATLTPAGTVFLGWAPHVTHVIDQLDRALTPLAESMRRISSE